MFVGQLFRYRSINPPLHFVGSVLHSSPDNNLMGVEEAAIVDGWRSPVGGPGVERTETLKWEQ